MTIAVIGGGLTGLSAAYRFAQKGAEVHVYEKERYLGGLSRGFKAPGWEWSLETFYHHFFTNDADLISLAGELNIADRLLTKRPITATLVGRKEKFINSIPRSPF